MNRVLWFALVLSLFSFTTTTAAAQTSAFGTFQLKTPEQSASINGGFSYFADKKAWLGFGGFLVVGEKPTYGYFGPRVRVTEWFELGASAGGQKVGDKFIDRYATSAFIGDPASFSSLTVLESNRRGIDEGGWYTHRDRLALGNLADFIPGVGFHARRYVGWGPYTDLTYKPWGLTTWGTWSPWDPEAASDFNGKSVLFGIRWRSP